MTSETEQRNYEAFFNAYVECALWSSTDDNDEPLDKNYNRDDLAPETVEQMRKDCWEFLTKDEDDPTTMLLAHMPSRLYERAGRDFWLSRCGHGSNFLDGDWDFTSVGGEDMGDKLMERAEAFGNVDLYVGFNFLICC